MNHRRKSHVPTVWALLAALVGGVGTALASPPAAAKKKPLPGIKKLLHISLTLRRENAAREARYIQALPQAAKAIDGILLAVPSYHEEPNAAEDPQVKRFLAACKANQLEVYWGRRLWVTWTNLSHHQQEADDLFSSGYYEAFLKRLNAEGQKIGAAGTCAYCEPHGGSPFNSKAFRQNFDAAEQGRVREAIRSARQSAEPATLVYPAGSGNPKHYSYALRQLGRQYLHHKTYKVVDPKKAAIRPPGDQRVQLDWWGTWVTTKPKWAALGKRPMTVEEWLAIDFDKVAKRFPENRQGGVWLYAKASEMIEVMEALGQAASK